MRRSQRDRPHARTDEDGLDRARKIDRVARLAEPVHDAGHVTDGPAGLYSKPQIRVHEEDAARACGTDRETIGRPKLIELAASREDGRPRTKAGAAQRNARSERGHWREPGAAHVAADGLQRTGRGE